MVRKYANPPIVEALCEFRFRADSPWDLAIPGLVYERLQPLFPKRRQAQRVSVELSAHAEGVLQQVQPIELVQFLREDERALIQVGQHLLVINQLKPYPTWEQFSELIQQGFEAYCIASKPKAIQRIVLRYINKIDIPTEEIQLEDYFQFFPYVGPNFPDTFGAFIAGVQIPYDAGDDVLRVQLSNATEQATGALSAVLDLEYVFSSPGSLPITDNINRVQLAHERLETIFEACITDSLRNLFGEES